MVRTGNVDFSCKRLTSIEIRKSKYHIIRRVRFRWDPPWERYLDPRLNGIDKIWAVDLADMQAFSKFNHGIKYLLAVIDVFSKYGWLIPLKDKTGKSVASALKTIFKERKPEKMG